MVQKKIPLINASHGSDTRNIINELIRLFNQMGYTYDDALKRAHNILNEANKVNGENADIRRQINDVIKDLNESGVSVPEVVQARGVHPVLNERLEDNEKRMFDESLVLHKEQKPLITIIDDDGRTELYNDLFQVVLDEQVPVTAALITSRITESSDFTITISEFEEMKESGLVEFQSHTHTHPHLADLTNEDDIESEMALSKEWLKQNGVDAEYMIYPFNSQNKTVRRITRKYYKGGFGSGGRHNRTPVRTYNMSRYDIDGMTLEQQKDAIDNAIENNGWVVFNTHAAYPSWNKEDFRALIQYAKSVNIEFSTVKEAMKHFGNLIDFGDPEDTFSYSHGILDAKGELHGTLKSGYTKLYDDDVNITRPADYFPTGISASYATNSNAGEKGFPSAGALITHRDEVNVDFTFQFFYKYNSNDALIRWWRSSVNDWSEFRSTRDIAFTNISSVNLTAETPIDDYPVNMSSVYFTGSQATAQGFPSAGKLITFKDSISVDYSFQEYHKYNSKDVYKRWWNISTNSWTEFQLQ